MKRVLIALLARLAGYLPDRFRDRWLAGAATGVGIAGLGANALLSALGFTAVAHSSGAVILTGAGGYIAGTYGVASIIALITSWFALFFLFPICVVIGIIVFLWKRRSLRPKKLE